MLIPGYLEQLSGLVHCSALAHRGGPVKLWEMIGKGGGGVVWWPLIHWEGSTDLVVNIMTAAIKQT